MGLCDKDCCKKCDRLTICGGCEKCLGKPYDGYCFIYELIQEKGFAEYIKLKNKLIDIINDLGIENLHIDNLYLLHGDYINLEYELDNGFKFKLLNDKDIYFGNQVEIENDERCYGIATNGKIIVVSRYGCNGSNPELILFKKL